MKLCSAAATVWRLAPVLSMCDGGTIAMSCYCTSGWPAAKDAGDAAGWRAVV